MSRYPLFDRQQIELQSLEQRGHELHPDQCLPLDAPIWSYRDPGLPVLTQAIQQARADGKAVILMMGAHPIKLGLSRYLIDLIERGWVTHLATNGAGIIHDFELALGAGTSEDVARWIQQGQFGLWRETGQLNSIIHEAAKCREGLGEAVGRFICEHRLPARDVSIAAAGWRCGVPITAHVSIGSDIIHAHANCNGRALGAASYTDFLIFAHSVSQLEGGVYLNVGTAVTGPEVYLKALAMARNVARQRQEKITNLTTAVFDLVQLPANYHDGSPPKDHPLYYYRPWKTILVRTVADGGQSFYFCGDHRVTLPNLWNGLCGRNRQIAAA